MLGTPPDDWMSIAASEGEPELSGEEESAVLLFGVAMPESDPEMMARLFWADQEGWARVEIFTMSRALEVGRLVSLGSLH